MIVDRQIIGVAMMVCALLPLHVSATGKITKITISEGSVELVFDTTPGETYQVQFCHDLVAGDWGIAVVSFQADVSVSARTIEENGSSCWFRVVRVDPDATGEPTPPSPPPPPPPPPPFS